MFYKFLIFALLLSLCACKKEAPQQANTQEEVALLKIDYLTTTFEGGTTWTFNPHSTFTIVPTYSAPGDFGNLKLTYQEENTQLFDGDIHWMGKGNLNYPASISAAATFATTSSTLQQPVFEEIEYSGYPSNHPTTVPSDLWQEIKDLQLVEDYLTSNPTGKIHFFLYTPSVGIGDPADWDWIVYLKD